MKTVIPVIALSFAFALQGCGKQESSPATASAAPPSPSSATAARVPPAAKAKPEATPEASWDNKAQAYIRINNGLTDFNSPRNAAFAQWAEEARARVEKGDYKSIRGGTSNFGESFIRDLKAALNNSASMPEADVAAQNLLDVVQKYLPNWKSLEQYNTAKKYEDDNGAAGKQMLPMYKEGIQQINAALNQFSAKVDVIARESSARTMARLKSEGRLLELYNMEAMAAARAVADTFNDAADFKSQAKIAQANAQLQVMETKLVEMKAEHDKRKAESPKSLPMMDQYDSVISSLTSFAGKYRESRKDPAKFNDAIQEFNRAIESSNRMRI
ncbi:MAG: DUF3829 domain-containing protein [Comamonadaceae bacterium]|nr:MAG: DUF3829 domain-containing protein [Comamonadaceae bacterium]